ncbi:GNAT family N-acetyltransferase [Paraburkholderia acidisoli]|uniref:GNAT family N-acetyltransferase n=1 Tax=Paraburkholderia acidisoli TaxID=2571748 RepID=A0A7Z2JJG6_9BURK|nr:GNAT family N-acetyltransferase [Paraburkholderia acidisoli]QGZ66771.1 GNAT family N-acetyltransferase [Paraburkholderia acidisoli]
MTDAITVRALSAAEAHAHADALADVLIDCVEGGASVSFMLPISRATALAFWRSVAEGVAHGERVLLAAFDNNARLAGTAQLVVAQPENQPHRADVAKVLVCRAARGRGVGQRLMQAVEAAAYAAGKTVLVLDTVTGGAAERLYTRAGWQRVGAVPNYALMPDGALCGTTFYHKQLAAFDANPAQDARNASEGRMPNMRR